MSDTSKIDVRALAALARLDVSEAELERLEKELPNILEFVDTIQQAQVATTERIPVLRNVMREDGEPHESGMYTDAVLAQAPAVQANRLVVKQVVSRKSAQGRSASGGK